MHRRTTHLADCTVADHNALDRLHGYAALKSRAEADSKCQKSVTMIRDDSTYSE